MIVFVVSCCLIVGSLLLWVSSFIALGEIRREQLILASEMKLINNSIVKVRDGLNKNIDGYVVSGSTRAVPYRNTYSAN